MMNDRDHRNWFGFLEKLAALSREYSVDDLRWLRKEAAHRYPSAIPLVEACLSLASSDVRPTKVDVPTNASSHIKHHVAARASLPVSQALSDISRFHSNSDLIKFAKATMPELPDLRFDKMGRARIVDTIVAYAQRAPVAVRRDFEMALLGREMASSPSQTGSSFLSSWEKVIKGT